MELDFHNDLKIEKNKLDYEWINQPYMYKMYADAWATAENEKVILKDELDQLKITVASEIRNNPPVDNTGKPEKLTIARLDELILSNTKIIDKQKEYNKAVFNVNLLNNSKNAFEQRKKALEKLVDLFGLSYFGQPKNTQERINTVSENTGHTRPGLRRRQLSGEPIKDGEAF